VEAARIPAGEAHIPAAAAAGPEEELTEAALTAAAAGGCSAVRQTCANPNRRAWNPGRELP